MSEQTLTPESIRVAYITLGCAKNEVDTDRMRSLMRAAGFLEAETLEDAGLVIINTCSFLSTATKESVEATLEVAESRYGSHAHIPLIMCGCVPSRYGEELERELPEVDAFVASQDEDGIVEVAERVLGIERVKASLSPTAVMRTIEGASAFIKISEGCDRFCTFCAIPNIRGRYVSRPEKEILDEARYLLEGGTKELVLIGQDTGVWGHDFETPSTLAALLRSVAEVARPFGAWVRVLYLQPEGMTDELIAVLRDVDEVLPYIDIPIQHCNAGILKDMARSGSTEELKVLFDRLRAEIPHMILRTTAMAGFPGEDDEAFEELADFLEEQCFDYCSVFTYSQEEGTRAATLPHQVDENIKLERTQRLVDIAEAMGFGATAAHVGEVAEVIIDGIEETDEGYELIGHAWFQAPDCDGAVHIPEGEASVGDKVRVRFTESFCYELVGELCS